MLPASKQWRQSTESLKKKKERKQPALLVNDISPENGASKFGLK